VAAVAATAAAMKSCDLSMQLLQTVDLGWRECVLGIWRSLLQNCRVVCALHLSPVLVCIWTHALIRGGLLSCVC
jgi:hypothetical protein